MVYEKPENLNPSRPHCIKYHSATKGNEEVLRNRKDGSKWVLLVVVLINIFLNFLLLGGLQ